MVATHERRIARRRRAGKLCILVTTDSHLQFQQNLSVRRIAIVALLTTSWPRIQQAIPAVVNAIADAKPGSYAEVEIP